MVRTLDRKDCAMLHLVLKRKWYDMIERGEKKEEYRSYDVWCKRITKWLHKFNTNPQIQHLVVAFQRGYTKPSMWFDVFCVASEQAIGREETHPEWGEPDTPHYVISLGERVVLE